MCRTDKKNKRKRCHRVRRAGFTLIEILLVMALLSIVALATYSTFNSGIKIWQRLTKGAPAEHLNIFLERISDDLRNSFKFTEIKFVGRGGSISFATLVLTEIDQGGKDLTVGEVGYGFDAERETLDRWHRDYSQSYQNKSTPSREMMNNVKSLSFQYHYCDPEEEICIWKDVWEEEKEEKIPQAVRINIVFADGAEIKRITKTITISTGG